MVFGTLIGENLWGFSIHVPPQPPPKKIKKKNINKIYKFLFIEIDVWDHALNLEKKRNKGKHKCIDVVEIERIIHD